MATLEVSLLGTPIVLLDRQPVAFESRKATALLAFLAVASESRLRSELATLLWPESDSKRARGALRYTFSVLQSALGKEWFQSDRAIIGLRQSTHCTVDIVQFRSLLAGGRDHSHAPDTACIKCIEPINTAVALYRGDFLTGFGLRDSVNFDEWQFFQVEGFRHQMSSALRRRIRYYTQQADYHQALASARQLLQLEPLQESVQREVMQLYAQSGQWELALQQYEVCHRLLDTELGVPPSLATTQLYEKIRVHRLEGGALPPGSISPTDGVAPPAQPLERPHNLSASTMPILGREAEREALHALLNDPNCRMVTLLGPGGIGKTRLAYQIATDLCKAPDGLFVNGVYFVSLAAVESAALLISAIASALELSFSGSKAPKDQLLQHLKRQQILLVLDNFEQLVSTAPLLAEFLNATGEIKLLVTSRVRLNLHEEWLYEIQGLPIPLVDATSEEELAANDSVQLFYWRAHQLDKHFDLTDALPSVAQICRLLQGMPLGIELAAGWVRTFSCAEIARQIQQDLDFLATPSQNVPERHRSLRAAFNHSWRGLDPEEQAIFARAALFRGGFGLDAAKAVTGASPSTLGALVDKSMVQRVHQQKNQPDRYTIHELLRQYAEEELDETERDATHQRHCRYFAIFVEEKLPHRSMASEDHALDEVRVELENVRLAWGWLAEQIKVARTEMARQFLADRLGQFVPMLAHFYLRFSRFEEGRQQFSDTATAMRMAKWAELVGEDLSQSCAYRLAQVEARLAEFDFNLSRFHEVAQTYERLLPSFHRAEEPNEIGSAQVGLGKTLIRMGRYAEAEPLLLESLGIFRDTGDVTGTTAALNGLGILYSNQGRFDEARPYYQEFLSIARANQHMRGTANALNNLGSNYARAGQHKKARPLYQECHRLSLASGERLVVAVALSNLGSVSRALAQFSDARRYYAESLSICREIGDRRWTAAGLNGLGLTLVDSQAFDEAILHLQEGLSIAREIESPPDILDALAAIGEIVLHRGRISEAVAVLTFVSSHPVTQTLAKQRSKKLLMKVDKNEINVDDIDVGDLHHQGIDDIIALATRQMNDPSNKAHTS